MKDYFQLTKTSTYSLISILPLLIAYETLIIFVNSDNGLKVRVGADIWIKEMFASIGLKGHLAAGGILLVIGTLIFIYDKKKKLVLRTKFFVVMILESLFYSIFLAIIISRTVSYIFANIPWLTSAFLIDSNGPGEGNNFWLQITLSIGAGLYEELFFRVLLVSTLTYLFKKFIFDQKNASFTAAALVGAFLFSLVHYVGPFGDEFTLPSFTFRFLFGLAFNILYVARGFGIVAWTHALYDIILTITLR